MKVPKKLKLPSTSFYVNRRMCRNDNMYGKLVTSTIIKNTFSQNLAFFLELRFFFLRIKIFFQNFTFYILLLGISLFSECQYFFRISFYFQNCSFIQNFPFCRISLIFQIFPFFQNVFFWQPKIMEVILSIRMQPCSSANTHPEENATTHAMKHTIR